MSLGLPFEQKSDDPVPKVIQGYVSVQGSKSVFAVARVRWPVSCKPFQAKKTDRDQVRRTLEKAGFHIIGESPLGFAVSGPAGSYEELSGGKVETRERLMQAEAGRVRYVTHVDLVGPKQPRVLGVGMARSRTAKIDGILIERPRVFHGVFPSPLPPNPGRFHLRVPDDIAVALGAVGVHREGHSGEGVLVAMPDSGQYRHPFFTAHAYAVKTAITVVPGTDVQKDVVGHGTGESANIFAVAPGAVLQPIRAADDAGRLIGAIGGFLKAKELNPKIITNSWGGDGPFPPVGGPDEFDRAWALEIQDAIERGMFVVFSAGNGQFSIEPQVPGVLAAGGAFMSQDMELRASDYTSGYESPWFAGVTVPTVSGLVGMRPRAQYIMLPVQPGCEIDVAESEPAPPHDPNTDGTTANDGWALFSGTSAAAPQIAGVVALILGAKPGLTPAQVTEALTHSAVDVTSGRCHPRFNNEAGIGPDAATGHGLVDSQAALAYARTKF